MRTASIGVYCADILQSLGAISNNEAALARVAKYLRKVVKEQEPDPTLMTEEEFFARVDESRAQIEQGRVHRMLPNETLTEFLERVNRQ